MLRQKGDTDMVVYYAREKGWTTDDYAKACEWHREGYTVITYNFSCNPVRICNWRTHKIAKIAPEDNFGVEVME